MSDDECPHGLDINWCSLCKAAAEGRVPGRRRGGAVSRPSARPAGAVGSSRPSTGRPGAGRGPRSAGPTARTPAAPLTPDRALAQLRPVLFHATAYGSWESISASGLRTAARLLADAGRASPTTLRESSVEVPVGGATAELRDQRLLARSRIEAHLDGIGLGEWLALLDERVHLFARQKDLTALLTRYQGEGQDMVVLDTARTLAQAGDRIEVATVRSGAPEPWATCRCRGRDTFVPLALFEGSVADIEEVTVVGGLDDIGPLVTRVVRYHPDRSTEVVWERP